MVRTPKPIKTPLTPQKVAKPVHGKLSVHWESNRIPVDSARRQNVWWSRPIVKNQVIVDWVGWPITAVNVSYDNSTSLLTAVNVQTAIDELVVIMAWITGSTFEIDEFVSGVWQTVFNLSQLPVSADAVFVSNGSAQYIKQWLAREYTVAWSVVTFNSPQSSGDVITVQYVVAGWVGSGEVNTASNLWGGNNIFASKVGVDLRLRSLVAGTNVTLTSSPTEILINAASAQKDYCIATNTLPQGIPDALETVVVSPAYTTNNAGMTATADRILILDAWVYSITGTCRWNSGSPATWFRQMAVYRNGGSINWKFYLSILPALESGGIYCNVSFLWELAVNDLIDMRVYHNRGGSTTLLESTLSVHKI